MMSGMKQARGTDAGLHRYDPHGTARMESLAGTPLASFTSRAIAFLLDLLVVLLLFAPTMLLIRWLRAGFDSQAHVEAHLDFHDFYSLIFIELYFGLCLYFGRGQTPGKRIAGIRVLSLERDRITLWQATERALGYGASMLEGGFGFFQYFIHPNHRCVHDRIAETIVVKERGRRHHDAASLLTT
jgi:uncharacterized RDD family membrane protein YckC